VGDKQTYNTHTSLTLIYLRILLHLQHTPTTNIFSLHALTMNHLQLAAYRYALYLCLSQTTHTNKHTNIHTFHTHTTRTYVQ